MKEFFSLLLQTALFEGFSEQDLAGVLGCLPARRRRFAKNAVILLAGEPATDVGIVLSGDIRVLQEDLLGNRSILAEFGPGHLFAEAFACARVGSIPVTVTAASDCEVLFLGYRQIVTTCSSACGFHTRLIANMMAILAQKNLLLSEKLAVMSRRSTREKLLAYLSGQATRAGSREFSIPFNRQELADYLCVDRSAMSAELGRLRGEGVLDFSRSRFVLLGETHPI